MSGSVVLVVSKVFFHALEVRRSQTPEKPSIAESPAAVTILGMPFRVSEYMPMDCFGLETASGIEIFRMEHVRSTVKAKEAAE